MFHSSLSTENLFQIHGPLFGGKKKKVPDSVNSELIASDLVRYRRRAEMLTLRSSVNDDLLR